jgi:hypothetical protein
LGPGLELLPGASSVGAIGTVAVFTVKYMMGAVVLDPAELVADTVQM